MSTSASSTNNIIANCNIILIILQSLVGFNQPSSTESTKTLGNDFVFVETSKLESNKYISMRNFDKQQIFQLKTTITMQMNVIRYFKTKILFYLFNSATKLTLM